MGLALLALVVIPLGINCDNYWDKLDVQCISDGAKVTEQSVSITERHCVMKASVAMQTGLLLIQFNMQSQVCRIFRYQSVCSLLVPGVSSACLTFTRFPVNLKSINPKLSNLWLADDVSQLENLICQIDEDTNRFYLMNTQWVSDGLAFDGLTSYMVLNKTSIGFTGGLTWLLKIKRNPKVQPFIEFVECSQLGSGNYYAHMWEYDAARKLSSKPYTVTGHMLPRLYSAANTLSSSSSDWQNIGFIMDRDGIWPHYFFNNSFMSNSSTTADTFTKNLTNLCVTFGQRLGDSRIFNGTLRALAFANATMSEAEIQQFFSLIP